MGSHQSDLPGLPGWPRDRTSGGPNAGVGEDQPGSLPVPWAGMPGTSGMPARLQPTAPGSIATAGPESAPAPRSVTLTEQIRSVQPPDVARQAAGELGMLARELDALPDLLATAGLARTRGNEYRETVLDYLDLCHLAFAAVAEEQLEQVGAEPEYRQAAVLVARSITRLKQEADQVPSTQRPPRWLPFMWRRRMRLIRLGLKAWQAGVDPVPNPLRMGRALFVLQGYLGLASAGAIDLALLDMLISFTLSLAGLLTLGACLLLSWALVAGASTVVSNYAGFLVTCALTLLIAVLLSATRALPLGLLMGASVFGPTHAACLGVRGSRVTSLVLRVWWLLIGCASAAGILVALGAGAAALIGNGPFPAPASALDAVYLGGAILYYAVVLAVAVCIAALLLLALPFAAIAQVQFVRELAGNPRWVPAARRYALPAALAVVLFVTFSLLGVASNVASSLHWEQIDIVKVSFSFFDGILTLRGVLFILVLALPYLLLLDLPYRVGIRRWQRQRLANLDARRADLESQVRRLSVQPPTDEVLRAMQYDLVLLQFYRAQTEEARTTSSAPFRLEARLVGLVVAVAGALVLDGTGGFVIRLLLPSH